MRVLIFAVLFILALPGNSTRAQGKDTIVQRMIHHKLIDKRQAKKVEKILMQFEERSAMAYLHALYEIEHKRIFGHYSGLSFLTTYNYDTTGGHKHDWSKWFDELSDYLVRLKASSLINEKQFRKLQPRIINEKLFARTQLLEVATKEAILGEVMAPKKLSIFADKLRDASVITRNYDEMLSAIRKGELEEPVQLLKYFNNYVVVGESEYATVPEEYLEVIHEKTSTVLPELKFTDFHFDVVFDSAQSSPDSHEYNFLVTLNSHGNVYKQRSYYKLVDPVRDTTFSVGLDYQTYYKIFNKILTDLQSPYRLHLVTPHCADEVDCGYFGIVALTNDQSDVLRQFSDLLRLSYESSDNSITTIQIDSAITLYEKIGLLDHIDRSHIDAVKEKVSASEITTLNDVLSSFPDVIHHFDTELSNLENPYSELVEAYARISHGKFRPSGVSDDFDLEGKKWATLRLQIDGRKYEKKFRIDGDWIDADYFKFIDAVVREIQLDGKFYGLYTGGQDVMVIFLTEAQHDFLRANQLVVFADEWERVEKE